MTPFDPGPFIDRAVALALAGIGREYPSKIAHVMAADDDARPPRELTPIFFGCFDWHSAVHAHWMLVRCCRCYPERSFVARVRSALDAGLTEPGIAAEGAYVGRPDRRGFERPYGLAWILQLAAELGAWEDDGGRRWSRALAPLETIAVDHLAHWLPRLTHPVRTGEHSQTAFAMGLALDAARSRGHEAFARLLAARAIDFHGRDAGWNLAFEPGGQDFLSPGLAEADLMRRVLDPPAFASWLDRFLPAPGGPGTLRPVTVSDRSDGKLVHLDGLNLSRAWMLEGIADGLPPDDARRAELHAAAGAHRAAGLDALASDDYMGTHWLGSFAVYLLTGRGRAAG